ncbi:MAG: hypothetical protein B7Z55_17245 [Planctomycetales bacterium 12-60-4]|nr:MAG: hypothetical protein B7Z55_17245 [Planctomycetales bacterium 12-60-4]
MRDHETAMCAYAQLAVLSHEKRQTPARDRFLLLCGVEACRAGWLDVAVRCREIHNRSQPAHQLAKHASLPDALRDPDFGRVVEHWERWCSYERAEHLLLGLNQSAAGECPESPRGAWVLEQLQTLEK